MCTFGNFWGFQIYFLFGKYRDRVYGLVDRGGVLGLRVQRGLMGGVEERARWKSCCQRVLGMGDSGVSSLGGCGGRVDLLVRSPEVSAGGGAVCCVFARTKWEKEGSVGCVRVRV